MTTPIIWTDLTLAPTADPEKLIADAAIVVVDDRIVWLGKKAELPATYVDSNSVQHGLQRAIVTPGLIDCHTHLVYGGNRAQEFAMRLAGARYEDIARQGGGILSTVRATRESSEDDLYRSALRRLDNLRREGVTAIEIKSGYGLDLETERKMLRVARRLGESRPVTVRTTFLGAHALPPEYSDRADDYIDLVCNVMMPALAAEGLIDAVDVFCEHIAFNLAQTERVLNKAQSLGLDSNVHAEQMSLMGASQLAARYQALSTDHLEYLDEASIKP